MVGLAVEVTPTCSRAPIEVCTTMTCTCNDDILIEPGWIKARFVSSQRVIDHQSGRWVVLQFSGWSIFVRRQISRRKDSKSLRYRRSCWMARFEEKEDHYVSSHTP